jgi:hypothetical protein
VASQLTSGWGDEIDDPTVDELRRCVEERDPKDDEHGDLSFSTDEGAITSFGSGRLVFFRPPDGSPRHLLKVSAQRLLALWQALGEGNLELIEQEPWQPGHGYVRTPEEQAALEAWSLEQDREFYDALGPEREDERCREPGCSRGVVAQSACCRPHHFAQVKYRTSPFEH